MKYIDLKFNKELKVLRDNATLWCAHLPVIAQLFNLNMHIWYWMIEKYFRFW